jgi:hypothetical protein
VLRSFLALALTAAAAAPAPAAKARRVLSPRSFPGWQVHNVAFPSVLHDPASGSYRMFYAGSPAARINASTWEQWATLTAASSNGLTWTFPDDYEPILVPHRFQEGEIADPAKLAARFDSVAAFGASALQDPGGYRLWYTGWSGAFAPAAAGTAREVGHAIGLATSRDGARWARRPGAARAGAVLAPGAAGEPDAMGAGQPSVVRRGDALLMLYECFDGERWRICSAASTDGLAWTKQGIALDVGADGAADALGARNPVVVRRGSAYELWYQGQGTASPRYRVLRAASPDGSAWTKRAGQVALHPETPVTGDERIHVDSVLPLPGGDTRVFFARELTTTRPTPYGPLATRRHHIYTEIVKP